jgi:hypothetical protein
MDGMNCWRLCDVFTVVDAALLIVGKEDPADWDNVLGCSEQDRPDNFTAAFRALSHAIEGKRLQADIRYYESSMVKNIDWEATNVRRDS